MAIQAKRFSLFDKDTNIGISDLTGIEYGGVTNADFLKNSISDLTEKFEGITKGLYEDKLGLTKELQSKFDDSVLEVKGILGGIKDFSKATIGEIDSAIKSLFPSNPVAQSIFSQMSDKCRKAAMNNTGFGKPYDVGAKCGDKTRSSGNSSCSTSSFSNLLNQLTGGAYGSVYQDLNNALKSLMGLAAFGYRMNMCGVFNALAGGLGIGDKGVLARAGAGVLAILGKTKNSLGVFDLANASNIMGLKIKPEFPGAAKSVFESIGAAKFSAKELLSTGDRLMGSAEIFDPSYSVVDMIEAKSSSLKGLLTAQSNKEPFSLLSAKIDRASLDLSRFNAQNKFSLNSFA